MSALAAVDVKFFPVGEYDTLKLDDFFDTEHRRFRLSPSVGTAGAQD